MTSPASKSGPKLSPSQEILRPASPELAYLWRAVERVKWNSLAVVPADPHTEAKGVAWALVSTQQLMGGPQPQLLSAQGLTQSAASMFILDMTLGSQSKEHGVVVAVDPVVTNDAGIPVVLAADAVLLVTTLTEARFVSFRRTLDLIGRDRVIGCVTLRPNPDSEEPTR